MHRHSRLVSPFEFTQHEGSFEFQAVCDQVLALDIGGENLFKLWIEAVKQTSNALMTWFPCVVSRCG